MTTLAYMLTILQAEVAGGVAGATGVAGLMTWLVKRHIRRRDERDKKLNDKLDRIIDTQHQVAIDLTIAKQKLEAGDSRMERIEANVDDLRQDMRVVKRGATDKHEKQ